MTNSGSADETESEMRTRKTRLLAHEKEFEKPAPDRIAEKPADRL